MTARIFIITFKPYTVETFRFIQNLIAQLQLLLPNPKSEIRNCCSNRIFVLLKAKNNVLFKRTHSEYFKDLSPIANKILKPEQFIN